LIILIMFGEEYKLSVWETLIQIKNIADI
jgi:hypothetical protein